MKFYCDACHTKYAISDDKVRGKVLRIRCKKCENIITVRENVAPESRASNSGAASRAGRTDPPTTPKASRRSAEVPTTSWYYSLNGETFGPFTLAVLRDKYASASLGDATYVWHQTMSAWTPVAQVEAFAASLQQGQKIRPRMKTLGFTGALEAVKVEEAPKGKQGGTVPRRQPAMTPAPARTHNVTPAPSKPQAKRPPVPTPQPRRALPPKPQKPSAPEPRPADPISEATLVTEPATPSESPATPTEARATSSEVAAPALDPKPTPKPDPTPKGEPPKIQQGGPPPRPKPPARPTMEKPPRPGGSAASAPPTPEARPIKDARQDRLERLKNRLSLDGLSGMEAVKTTETPRAPADKAPLPRPVDGSAELTFAPDLDRGSSEAEVSASDETPTLASDVIDFDLPLKGDKSSSLETSSTSDILEIPVSSSSVSAEHRDEPLDSGIVPIFGREAELGSSASSALSAAGQTSESLLVEMKSLQKEGQGSRRAMYVGGVLLVLAIVGVGVAVAMLAGPEEDAEPVAEVVQPKQKDELVVKRYTQAELDRMQQMQLDEELLDEDAEEAPSDTVEAAVADEVEPPAAAVAVKQPTTTPSMQAPPEAKSAPRVVTPTEKTPPKTTARIAPSKQTEEKAEPEPSRPKTEDELISSLLAPRKEIAVRRPEDELANRKAPTAGLSKQQAVEGFKHVKKSVRSCRESHNRRAPPLDVGKIKILVTVQPEGKVSEFVINSDAVKHTEFERCMQAHRSRWKFPAFEGDPVQINTAIVL